MKPVISKKLDGDTQNIGLEVLHKYNLYKRVIFSWDGFRRAHPENTSFYLKKKKKYNDCIQNCGSWHSLMGDHDLLLLYYTVDWWGWLFGLLASPVLGPHKSLHKV